MFCQLIFGIQRRYWEIDKIILSHKPLLHCLLPCVVRCHSSADHTCLVPVVCTYLSDFYFYRHSLGISLWHFGWWMLKCIPTWVFWPLSPQLLIVEYSFIKWSDSLLMHLAEKAISISWVSESWTHTRSMFKMLTNKLFRFGSLDLK